MPTDILIPIIYAGSRVEDAELRYCLRSIERHLSNVGNIYIVGHLTAWCKNVVHIPFEDNVNSWERAHNIYNKVMAGINQPDIKLTIVEGSHMNFETIEYEGAGISNDFLFMNDDHFLLTDYELPNFPYYHRGPIDLPRLEINQPQLKQMRNTKQALLGRWCIDYDVHSPIMYNKHSFREAFAGLQWKEYGYGVKSIYGNHTLHPDMGVQITDVKFHKPMTKQECYAAIEGLPWFSTGDAVLLSGGMMEVLGELYPTPSKYEI